MWWGTEVLSQAHQLQKAQPKASPSGWIRAVTRAGDGKEDQRRASALLANVAELKASYVREAELALTR